ncbi:hypothetical protein D3C77_625780 [compost metagenome]
MGFGLGAVALEKHRQARQFKPLALVTLEVDAIDRLRRNRPGVRAGTAAQDQADTQGQQQV